MASLGGLPGLSRGPPPCLAQLCSGRIRNFPGIKNGRKPYHGGEALVHHVAGTDVCEVDEIHGLADHAAVNPPSSPLLLWNMEPWEIW